MMYDRRSDYRQVFGGELCDNFAKCRYVHKIASARMIPLGLDQASSTTLTRVHRTVLESV
jgi:hypothetical protein